MNPERWPEIKQMLQAAMQLEPAQRPAYLDHACSGDPTLRQQVESLLVANGDVRSSFLASSPLERVSLGRGTKLGPYEIITSIGAGGMGDVYRAHDPRLGRDVAIKVLPQVFSTNANRLRRFEQEARAAAALNHPNILAVHDIGTTEQAIPYVVSELLEGETLREVLERGPLPPRKATDCALQIAHGLAVAHDKGIVHRDLKPENLFATREGQIKILDFGLAKLVHAEDLSPDSPTLRSETGPGVVIGTVGYMSPEQVRGQKVDHRSDIFALGAILYEMLSGKRALQGDTPADTMSAILSRDPPDLLETNRNISPALNRVVRRCLEKNPDERFHAVRDVAFALEAISDTPAPTIAIPEIQEASSSVHELRIPSKRLHIYWSLTAVLALSVAAGLVYQALKRRAPAKSEWEQVTNFADSVTSPALSPDGRILAFLRGPSTWASSESIYLKLLPQGEPVQVTRDNQVKMSLAFSPDGSRIAYSVAPTWATWVAPVLGGQPQLMLANVSGLTWVDDRHILFSEIKGGVHMAIVTATESRTEERDVYVPAQETGMAHRSYISPDHKWVLVVEMNATRWMPCRLVPFNGSSPGKPVGPPGAGCTYAAWSPDGKWMFLNSGADVAPHIWRQRFPDGQPEQLTFGPTEQEGIALAPDGRSLLTSVGITAGTVWVHDGAGERQISWTGSATFPIGQISSRAVFSLDGSKLYFLGQQGPQEPELWVADLKSGSRERVLPGINLRSQSYDVSRDGKLIAFDLPDAQGEANIWIASLDHRSPPRRLDSSSPENHPLFGPSDELFFQGREGTDSYIYRRALDGSARQKVVPNPIVRAQTLSPDGEWVVTEAPIVGENVTRGVKAYHWRDGIEKRVCYNLCIVRWTLDGKSIFLTVGDGRNFKTFAIPLRQGESFPDLPPSGVKSEADLAHLRGVHVINDFARPGPDISHYAFDRITVHRNIYCVPIP